MRIELNNLTHWRSDHIRAFVARCMKAERPDLCKHGAPTMRVRVVYTRRAGSSYSSGCAPLNSNRFTVRLSKHTPDRVDFAHVIAHELAHTRGLTHDRMNKCATYGRTGRWREIYAWADALPLEVVEKKVKVVTTDTKLLHVQRMLRAALTREKRAITLRKKWQAKEKYYTKKAAATPPSKGENHVQVQI